MWGGYLVVKQEQKPSQKVFFIVLAVVIVLGLISILVATRKDYDAFATCLVEKGYVMAGAEWCSHCKAQKDSFKGAFEDIIIPAGAYKDCEVDTDWCQNAGVTGYPTWITPDQHTIPGVQQLSTLAKLSGCSLR